MKIASMVLAGVLITSSVYGQTINACYNKKTGALKISNKCAKTETAISWNVSGQSGYNAPSVLDATGATIGVMVTLTRTIFIPSLNAFVTIDGNGKVEGYGALIYESGDCSGVGYVGYYQPDSPWNYKAISEYFGKYYMRTDEIMTKTIGSYNHVTYDYENHYTGYQCFRPCGYWYQVQYHCNVGWCYSDPVYRVDWLNMNEDCQNLGMRGRGEWTTIDQQVVSVQEVTLPFSLPLALPLSFK